MIYASTSAYALGRELGPEGATAELRRQVAEPTNESLPCARVVARLATFEQVAHHIDAAATSIGRARARAMAEFRERPDADVWISCDDDVEADLQTLKWLVDAVRESRGVCVVPCWLRRTEPIVNLILTQGVVRVVGPAKDGLAMGCVAGGFGLVAMHQDAVARVYEAHPELLFIDEDGREKLGAFVEVVEGGKWWTEDLTFFLKWLPSDVRREALVTGQSVHDGRLLRLDQVPALPRIASEVPKSVTL